MMIKMDQERKFLQMAILSKLFLLYKGTFIDFDKYGPGKLIYANGDTFEVILIK
jgi:hypothetical protein